MKTIEHKIKLVNSFNQSEDRFNSFESGNTILNNNELHSIITDIMLITSKDVALTQKGTKLYSEYSMPLLVINGWEYDIVILPYFKKIFLCNDRYPMEGGISEHEFKGCIKKLSIEFDEEAYNILMDAENVIKVNVR